MGAELSLENWNRPSAWNRVTVFSTLRSTSLAHTSASLSFPSLPLLLLLRANAPYMFPINDLLPFRFQFEEVIKHSYCSRSKPPTLLTKIDIVR